MFLRLRPRSGATWFIRQTPGPWDVRPVAKSWAKPRWITVCGDPVSLPLAGACDEEGWFVGYRLRRQIRTVPAALAADIAHV